MATETVLFTQEERHPVPISSFAFPSDISIFWNHFGDNSYYADYAGLTRKYAPRRILEIGVRFGYSACALCLGAIAAGMLNVEYYGMDAEYFGHEGELSNVHARRNLERIVPEVTAHVYSVNTQVQNFPPSVAFNTFQFINVDGDHGYEGCLKDMLATWPLLDVGGIMVIDDTGMEGVKRAINECLAIWNCEYQWYWNERGFAILKKGF